MNGLVKLSPEEGFWVQTLNPNTVQARELSSPNGERPGEAQA